MSTPPHLAGGVQAVLDTNQDRDIVRTAVAGPSRSAGLTAVDDQFGTHTLSREHSGH